MRLSRANKIIMAEMLIADAKEIGLTLKPIGNWVEVTPPDKVPPRLLVDMAKCGGEIAEILKATPNPPEENHG